ncbi:hypothetical protein ABL78_2514 [Leptomonas seymouri]|uniref:Uncharacterized protein n=1 Tax=Leptomonas seymouri TaxID=5684 RepID=A0A0N1ILJ8_LEPSE|nr:hypothetical protein ABL78_2514 [Leptomonas seymouri]|eukprot:KPI88395.1 hypothetical protein ABL78_2514 [Leptomonas seymouri]
MKHSGCCIAFPPLPLPPPSLPALKTSFTRSWGMESSSHGVPCFLNEMKRCESSGGIAAAENLRPLYPPTPISAFNIIITIITIYIFIEREGERRVCAHVSLLCAAHLAPRTDEWWPRSKTHRHTGRHSCFLFRLCSSSSSLRVFVFTSYLFLNWK